MIRIPVSFGEVVDKITILQLKIERIADPRKLDAVRDELQVVEDGWRLCFGDGFGAASGFAERLKAVNATLWDIEDAIRDCERRQSFGDEFVRLARAVYMTNDERSTLKREIEVLLGSPLREQKSYAAYGARDPGVPQV